MIECNSTKDMFDGGVEAIISIPDEERLLMI
jgi:hypothetical protein